MAEVARKRGIPRAQVALAWLLAKPAITAPIVGATKLQHLGDAIDAVAVKLSAEEIALLEEPYVPHEVEGFVLSDRFPAGATAQPPAEREGVGHDGQNLCSHAHRRRVAPVADA